jgi:ABC-type transporter Mla maintaining outer membrane lipid asymmetry ATPase subunit MlaF
VSTEGGGRWTARDSPFCECAHPGRLSVSMVIEVEGLSKSYGARLAVDDVGFTVTEGEIFGILGVNGAGKTTTVECL